MKRSMSTVSSIQVLQDNWTNWARRSSGVTARLCHIYTSISQLLLTMVVRLGTPKVAADRETGKARNKDCLFLSLPAVKKSNLRHCKDQECWHAGRSISTARPIAIKLDTQQKLDLLGKAQNCLRRALTGMGLLRGSSVDSQHVERYLDGWRTGGCVRGRWSSRRDACVEAQQKGESVVIVNV